jgi:hypothetical protein
MQTEYISPKEIMRLKKHNWKHRQDTKERISQTKTGKQMDPFTQAHRDHMREAAIKRWERYRQEKQNEKPIVMEYEIFPGPSEQF